MVDVQPSLHVPEPAGAYWSFHSATPEAPSVAVPEKALDPEIVAGPGSTSVTGVGAVLSIQRSSKTVEVTVSPPPVATARKS